jgi:hypothetical protein
MKKSWFVGLVVFITLVLLGIGLYFFFPSFQGVGNGVRPEIGSLFGNTDDNGENNTQGTTTTPAIPTNPEIPIEETPSLPEIGFKAFKIGEYAVSSLQPLDFRTSTTSTTTLLVSVGRGSGVVRLYDPKTEVTSIIGTISVPNIIASEFTENSLYVVVQSQDIDTVKTIVLKSDPRTPTEERFFSPVFTSSDVTSFFIEGNTIYFIEKIKSGSELYEYIPSTNKRTLLYRGVFSDLYGFARNGTVFLGTKAAAGMQGFIFKLDKEQGLLTKVTSGTAILGIPNQNGGVVLTTEFFSTSGQTRLYNVTTKESPLLSIRTMKEKCTPDFSTKTFMFCGGSSRVPANMPDAWYMGTTNLSDTLYLLDSERTSFSVLTTTGESVDVLNPKSSTYSGILTFVNKKDSHPWIIISK